MTADSAGPACVGNHGKTEPEDLPDADNGHLCHDCYRRLRHNVTQLPALVVWLEAHIAAVGGSAEVKVSGTADDPIPLRLDVLDLIGPFARDPGAIPRELVLEQDGDPSIEDTARSWSALVAEERDRNPPANDVTSMSNFLAASLSWIVEQPWVDEFAAEIASLVSRAARVAPWQAEKRRVKDEACDNCAMMALVTHVAEGVTVCEKRLGGCGKRRHISDYMQRARGREAS